MDQQAYIGTSGWSYRAWKDSFYAGVRQKDWLRFCAERFTGIEVNATFYRLQERSTFERWRDETPGDFRFAIKGNRFLTHNKKLADPVRSIQLERERARPGQQAGGRGLADAAFPEKKYGPAERFRDGAAALARGSPCIGASSPVVVR